jgi:hypothetical protein
VQEFELRAETTPAETTREPQAEVTANCQMDNTDGQNIEIVKLETLLGQYSKKPETTPVMTSAEAPLETTNDIFEVNSALPVDRSINSSHFELDGQLGKGIIKPQKVELATDGVHFKYDTPSHNFIKAEPIKEKPREYRVTCSDMESNTMEDVCKSNEPLITEIVAPVPDNVEVVSEAETPVDIPVREEETVPEVLANEDLPMKTESETTFEPVTMENLTAPTLPESNITNDVAVIWEASQTWLKLPLKNIYRITNRSLIILGKYNNKILEVSLSLITGVSLKQSWFAKLFGVGDLLIIIPDFSDPKVVLRGIPKPAKVKQLIESLCQNKV